MVATMTLEIAATEFVDASATRFAYRGLGPAMVAASGHDCVRAEICQSATKRCNTAMPRQRYCRAREHLRVEEAGVNGNCVLRDT
jgi:hypothetical protein